MPRRPLPLRYHFRTTRAGPQLHHLPFWRRLSGRLEHAVEALAKSGVSLWVQTAVDIQHRLDRRVPGPGGDLLGRGASGNPQRDRGMAKVMDPEALEVGRHGRRPPDPGPGRRQPQRPTLGGGEHEGGRFGVDVGGQVAVEYEDMPALTVAVSTDPEFLRRELHATSLQSLRSPVAWKLGLTRTEALTLLRDTSPQIVYFFCHGGIAQKTPYLQVGPRNESPITRDNLRAHKIQWAATRPLVFLNGCHTTALEPRYALEFVSAFVQKAHAAGVIGTEITVFEDLACDFAEECMRRFLVDGDAIGKAVRDARLALLARGNPLGLVYIPYVRPSLRLVPTGAPPPR
jgi:hypothetical protein